MNLTALAGLAFQVDWAGTRLQDRIPINQTDKYEKLMQADLNNRLVHHAGGLSTSNPISESTSNCVRLYADHLYRSLIERIEFPVSGEELARRFCRKHFPSQAIRRCRLYPFQYRPWRLDIYLSPICLMPGSSSQVISVTLEFKLMLSDPYEDRFPLRGLGRSMRDLANFLHHMAWDPQYMRVTI